MRFATYSLMFLWVFLAVSEGKTRNFDRRRRKDVIFETTDELKLSKGGHQLEELKPFPLSDQKDLQNADGQFPLGDGDIFQFHRKVLLEEKHRKMSDSGPNTPPAEETVPPEHAYGD